MQKNATTQALQSFENLQKDPKFIESELGLHGAPMKGFEE